MGHLILVGSLADRLGEYMGGDLGPRLVVDALPNGKATNSHALAAVTPGPTPRGSPGIMEPVSQLSRPACTQSIRLYQYPKAHQAEKRRHPQLSQRLEPR